MHPVSEEYGTRPMRWSLVWLKASPS